jgi:VTC domain-containing protein
MGAEPHIALLPQEKRPDLDAREETKFVFENTEAAVLRRFLESKGERIHYAGPVSEVHSLYFDDVRHSCARANLDGVGIRSKTRLRWYDHPTPRGALFLETKWRRHGLVGKRRLALNTDADLDGCSFRGLRRALGAALPDEAQHPFDVHSEAVVIVSYRREHFSIAGGAMRLTLDYDLRFTPQEERLRLRNRFDRPLSNFCLIEGKTRPGERRALQRALSPLPSRPTRFSKYVTACIAAGYVEDL